MADECALPWRTATLWLYSHPRSPGRSRFPPPLGRVCRRAPGRTGPLSSGAGHKGGEKGPSYDGLVWVFLLYLQDSVPRPTWLKKKQVGSRSGRALHEETGRLEGGSPPGEGEHNYVFVCLAKGQVRKASRNAGPHPQNGPLSHRLPWLAVLLQPFSSLLVLPFFLSVPFAWRSDFAGSVVLRFAMTRGPLFLSLLLLFMLDLRQGTFCTESTLVGRFICGARR